MKSLFLSLGALLLSLGVEALELRHIDEFQFAQGTSHGGFPLGGFSSACFDEDARVLRVLVDAKGYEGHPPRWVEIERVPTGWEAVRTVELKGPGPRSGEWESLANTGIDPEGIVCPVSGVFAGKIVVSSEGTLWRGEISEEPSLQVFDLNGLRLWVDEVPLEYSYRAGRTESNAGPEALAWFRGGFLLGWERPLLGERHHATWIWNTSTSLEYPASRVEGMEIGLTDWVALGEESLLSLERITWMEGSRFRSNAKLYEFFPDRGEKREVFDFNRNGLSSDNYEGVALGERFSDGSQMLYVVSDDNFSERQRTYIQSFLIYR